MGDRVLVVGTGLVGGSIGQGLRKAGDTVTGFDADPAHARAALDAGAIDGVADDLRTGVVSNDIVVVATPVGQVLATVASIADGAPDGTVVTDVGSTKATIVAEAERLLGPRRPFVGGHPMAGTEGEGIASARPDLFEDALWILTPTEGTDTHAYRLVHGLVGRLGARTLALSPSEHDRLVAIVSHLPYAIATALMAVAGRSGDARLFQTAAGSFRDVTRTAGSSPTVWRDIFVTNREAVLRELDRFTEALGSLRAAIDAATWSAFDELVREARAARELFPPKGERAPAHPVVVEVAIADRTGVLADVATAMGEAGINIEDVWVDHTPSGGVLRLLVDGDSTAMRAAQLLDAKDYRTTIVHER